MPAAFLLGLALLGGIILISRWYINADPKQLAKVVKWTSLVVLVGLIAVLAATGRLSWMMAALTGLAGWVMRFMRMQAAYRILRGTFGGGRPSPGGSSEVSTRFLHMTLDHESGGMSGRVVAGAFAGRNLDTLDDSELESLWRECLTDEESTKVLEAWLDREKGGDWRETFGKPQTSQTMTREEAYEVLGLEPGASDAEIKAAHRALITKLHPDRGGSTYLAAKINQAKDLLLA